MKKKILIFAHYYYPDKASTGQILKDVAEGLQDEFEVTVICTVPSYNGKIKDFYKKKKYYHEELNGVHIIRIRVPEFSKEKKMSRVYNILVYFFRAIWASESSGKQEYVLTLSQPPILGGLLGVICKCTKHAKMIYCIQDFNPEQIIAIGYSHNKILIKVLQSLDKFSCRKSDLVITVGRDLVDTLKQRFSGKDVPNYTMINNWIDEKEIYPLRSDEEKVKAFQKKYGLDGKFVIMYSGNIGLYYDLENLIQVVKRFGPGTKSADDREVVFAFVGGGSVLSKLKQYKKENCLDNVCFIPYQEREELIYSLNAADVHWCVNAKGIKGVSCPSKFYGIASCAKPILGVLESGSEIRMLIEEIGNGLVSNPGDYLSVEKNIWRFLELAGSDEIYQMGKLGYSYIIRNLTKEKSIRKYSEAIKKL